MPTKSTEHRNDEGTWDFTCDRTPCEFTSKRHVTRARAADRGQEHIREHESGEPMREIADYMKDLL